MHLKTIELRKFRNYDHQLLQFQAPVNVFVGDNGQGKTNLLEAIYLMTKGQSFRPGKNENFIQIDSQARHQRAQVQALIQKQGLDYDVTLSLAQSTKSALVNGKKVSANNLGQRFPSVLFSPESLAAIKEGPDLRRQLVDDFLLSWSSSAASVLADFRRCLRSRNRLLKDYKLGRYPEAQAEAMKKSLDVTYWSLATALTALRIEALREMAPELRQAFADFNGKNVDISVDYCISSDSAVTWDRAQIRDSIERRGKELHRAELDSGSSLVGPQKHDIRFLFAGQDARYYCSQGQQRALILSFKMAQVMYYYRVHRVLPILLLDDVLSELDSAKRANLIGFLKEIQSQIFLTTTDLSFPYNFGDKALGVYRIAGGRIEYC